MSSEQNNPAKEEEIIEAQEEQQTSAESEVEAVNTDADSDQVEDISIAELLERLAAAEQTVIDQKDSVVRAKAEVDNIRRRSAQEVEKARKFALDKFVDELLPVMDNMELALQHADHENDDLKPMIQGVELTLKTLVDAVKKFGVNVVDPMEQSFDPALHQAMGMQEVDGVEPNKVIAVMQKGYELNGRLIRPAMVMISKAKA